jgi:hypothetical protein
MFVQQRKKFYDLLRPDQDITEDKNGQSKKERKKMFSFGSSCTFCSQTNTSLDAYEALVVFRFYCSGLLNDCNHDLFEL